MSDLDYPYHIDARGRTAAAAEHVRDLIEQVLFTAPGERVMRPDFGAGLLSLNFEPNAVQLAAATQFLVQASLQQHLSHLIAVERVTVDAVDAVLQVNVQYRLLRDQTLHTTSFSGPAGGTAA